MTDKKKIREYTNGKITVTWEPEKCIHSEKCWRNLGEVFRPKQKPWINPEAADSETIINQVNKCPSGALGVHKNNEKQKNTMSQELTTELKVNKNGSLKVTGKVTIVLPDGTEEIKEGRFSLCRCGLSSKKPFCDGSHKETNFDENWDI